MLIKLNQKKTITMRLTLLFITISFLSFGQQTYVPDNIFEAYLESNGMGNGIPNDDYVTTANISGVTQLLVPNLGIADLTGIEDFTALDDLACGNNLLTTLDVSQNTALYYLNCWGNQLTTLDVSQNTALFAFYCEENQLTSLDVSQNPLLGVFNCSSNNLTCLNVKNGSNTAINSFNATNNPSLTCIEVDDVNWSNTNWTVVGGEIDVQMSFSMNCNNPCSGCVPTSSSITEVACDSYTAPDSQVYTSTGIYTATIQNAAGCDSVITIDLTVNTVDPSATQLNAVTLQANSSTGQYQWVDCDNNFSFLNGETNQVFTAASNGNYAVIVTENGCTDTSSCIVVNQVGIEELLHTQKQVVRILDVMGRETTFKPNTVLFYVFSDGTMRRVFKIED